jgi:2-polyprenyl-3-methyl-5-hydroxy-6-metoxy-1,4-benzoquinol methylase
MLRDIARRNERQQAVIRLCREFIPRGGVVLEVGCGAGIITRSLQRHAARVVAIDLSTSNIEIARRYARGSNTTFAVVDIARDPLPTGEAGHYDAMVLADVVEHLAPPDRIRVLRNLAGLLSPDGCMVLSFPSLEYQSWLRANAAHRLQIIDEDVTPEDVARESGLRLRHVRHISMWNITNIYVHVVLQRRMPVIAGSRRSRQWDRVRRLPALLTWWLRNAHTARRIRRAVSQNTGSRSPRAPQ